MDTIYTRGFLSQEIDAYRTGYRKKYAGQFAVCEEKSDAATVQLFAADLTTVNHSAQMHFLLALAFWCRCIRACQGALILLEKGLVPEGQTLIRSAYEFLFIGVASLIDKSVEKRLFATEYIERKKQAQAMLDHCTALDDHARRALKEVITNTPQVGRTITAYDAAKISGYLEFYATVYRGMSLISSHGTLSGTNSVFEDVGEDHAQMVFGPSDVLLEFSLGLVEKCLTEGLNRFKAILSPAE